MPQKRQRFGELRNRRGRARVEVQHALQVGRGILPASLAPFDVADRGDQVGAVRLRLLDDGEFLERAVVLAPAVVDVAHGTM